MDTNKLQKLREIKFILRKTCLLCINFNKGIDLWGTCKIHTYFHLKHKEERQLSVHALGDCPVWEETPVLYFDSNWDEFFDK